jgi:hypothetical protein
MSAKIKRHLWYYITMTLMLVIFLTMASLLSYNSTLEVFVLFAAACFYALWGIIHQHIHHHLTTKIMLEYILMGSLGFVLLLLLVQR